MQYGNSLENCYYNQEATIVDMKTIHLHLLLSYSFLSAFFQLLFLLSKKFFGPLPFFCSFPSSSPFSLHEQMNIITCLFALLCYTGDLCLYIRFRLNWKQQEKWYKTCVIAHRIHSIFLQIAVSNVDDAELCLFACELILECFVSTVPTRHIYRMLLVRMEQSLLPSPVFISVSPRLFSILSLYSVESVADRKYESRSCLKYCQFCSILLNIQHNSPQQN